MFNKHPINIVRKDMPSDVFTTGYDAIMESMLSKVQSENHPILALDGTNGADFQLLLQKIITVLEKQNYTVDVHGTNSYLKSGSELRKQFKDNITDNRAFGYVIKEDISAYFVENAKQLFKEQSINGENVVSIVFGPGAYWLTNGTATNTFFLDVSREYQQVEHKNQLLNFGFDWNKDKVEKYKISYFVEWPILENYRKAILTNIAEYIDMNRPSNPVSIAFSSLEVMIKDIAKRPLRVKPFFAPGIWGGQRLKEMIELPEDWVNCAWSFEPIAPENSILIGYNNQTIEVPFLIVMALEYQAIMGDRPVSLFGDYFPIRFDYLDTMDGDNLSCQVHPKQEYVQEHFNQHMTQQESYYIMEKQNDAKVYLGFTSSSAGESFKDAVVKAQETEVPFEFTDYINEFNSNQGELYLIPPGTVHTSGTDNLVLEISSTTWWFTFKIYDFLRKDLDGKPRPLNIDHGFNNLDFYKDKAWVEENLIQEPKLLEEQGNNAEYLLGQRDDLLFTVHRIHLEDQWEDNTNDEFIMLNLVEGEQVRIISLEDESIYVDLRYAESYILPSVFGAFKIVNIGSTPCKLVKAGVSPNWDVRLIEE